MTWISKKKKIERKKKNMPSATFFSYVMNIFQKASVFADSLSIPWIVDIQQSTLRHSKPCRRSENWPLDYFQTAWGRVPAGCLIPSSEDLGKCVQFISSGETTAKQVQLIHPDVIKEITKPQMLLDDWSMSRFSRAPGQKRLFPSEKLVRIFRSCWIFFRIKMKSFSP